MLTFRALALRRSEHRRATKNGNNKNTLSHPDDQTTQTTETPGFKPFTNDTCMGDQDVCGNIGSSVSKECCPRHRSRLSINMFQRQSRKSPWLFFHSSVFSTAILLILLWSLHYDLVVLQLRQQPLNKPSGHSHRPLRSPSNHQVSLLMQWLKLRRPAAWGQWQ